MPRKTPSKGAAGTSSAKGDAKEKGSSAKTSTARALRTPSSSSKKTARGTKPATQKSAGQTTESPSKSVKSPSKSVSETASDASAVSKKKKTKTTARKTKSFAGSGSSVGAEQAAELIDQLESGIATALDRLHGQVNDALGRLAEVSSTSGDPGPPVGMEDTRGVGGDVLERASASFQRMVTEVLEDQHAEMLPPLIALRQELVSRARMNGNGKAAEATDDEEDDFAQRGTETLDHVLTLAGVSRYEPREGERFDSLIHLAVGESHREDLDDGAVARVLQPGFRSRRGRIVAAAKVLVNRR